MPRATDRLSTALACPAKPAAIYQAIHTRYLCPTNFRGSRYKATCQAMSVTLSADDALNPEDNHREACNELCRRMAVKGGAQWLRSMMGGVLPDGSFAWIFIPSEA